MAGVNVGALTRLYICAAATEQALSASLSAPVVPAAALCVRGLAFARAGVVAFSWAGPSCWHAGCLPLRCAGAAGIVGEGGDDGGRALDVRALYELGLWCVVFP